MAAPDPAPPSVPRGMLRIGRIAGSDVLVSSSWFLIAALIAYLMGPRVEQVQAGLGAWKYVVGLAFAIALYLAILLHEASHALVARRLGFRVESITLHFLGGATAISGEARRPRQEFWIAVVGPLTSLAVGAVALVACLAMPPGLTRLLLEGLAGANLLIGVLNLVPGLPLDGGRVLKAGVWAATGRSYIGTVAAAWGGRITALAVAAWAILAANAGALVDPLLLTIVALFLWVGASQSLHTARVVERLSGLDAKTLARPALPVADDLPLAEALRRAEESGTPSIVTVSASGLPVGVVDPRAVAATPPERRPWVPASAVARRLDDGSALPESVSGTELVEALRRTPANAYVLLAPDGSVHGVLLGSDIARAARGR
ncbi:site-2 protease family protein [Nocardioides sp. zg-536]|uniref:Zinc metalloprotease n=1 Tax=Nocardioides faecalis TaxID=2803858 RepID=A0A939BRX2_9ACTN|nr:site-2 protease family protein [Nocardioides faecalis]MBM9459054.1 site-2 protease family protein [Nocardioides faecalis]MBS4753844.1 site-2 protease family protein [Nocardioides faecalis]QVI57319.1 site-2 protease family protein [Nocardioides faecalis]